MYKPSFYFIRISKVKIYFFLIKVLIENFENNGMEFIESLIKQMILKLIVS